MEQVNEGVPTVNADPDLVKLCQEYSSYLEFPELRNQQVMFKWKDGYIAYC
jgi:hypothetical protein